MQDPASLYVCGYWRVAYSISTDSAESEVVEEGGSNIPITEYFLLPPITMEQLRRSELLMEKRSPTIEFRDCCCLVRMIGTGHYDRVIDGIELIAMG